LTDFRFEDLCNVKEAGIAGNSSNSGRAAFFALKFFVKEKEVAHQVMPENSDFTIKNVPGKNTYKLNPSFVNE